ncbi:HlyD family secretion protein [Labrenzia sp. PHM005]|uniref:HlyD family secretion protein n=1 Tax=Labrenzia sp. PHM005 TaxID=2590016 RepID=UPI0011404A12|nr:biotin/lipoyl-binding protein [Labrenzia sp. PHM005]QDG77842.1 HlyD family secretion protein [Labrenzia sp. PHM005]
MLELIFSALITIVPDYLYRHYKQGKRFGHEINLFTVWYELRWGITSCAVLAITLLTVIFYFHPTTTNVTSLFRTVSILSDRPGRVEEVYVLDNEFVRAGEPIFRLDTQRQQAAAETARRRIAEVDAAATVAQAELAAAEGNIVSSESQLKQSQDELTRRQDLAGRNQNVVSEQELERLRLTVDGLSGSLDAIKAQRDAIQARLRVLLPAQRASAEAALTQAETEIEKSTVYAGTNGTVRQFKLKPGDLVNPILRPAGILVPEGSGRGRFQAGFGQISAQILHLGTIVEITCASKPLEVIPMAVTEIQRVIAGGQLRPTDQLIDIQDRARPGTILTVLEPIYAGHANYVPPGSRCIGVAYSNHDKAIKAGEISGFSAFLTRIVDGMGIANALVIRIQSLLLPVKVLVFPN